MLLMLTVAALIGSMSARPQHISERDSRSAGRSAAAPTFDEYRVPPSTIFKGVPAAPKFKTPGERMFRTVISDATKQGPNFAGRYRVADWGCGTGCESVAIIDVESGAVFDGPFGKLPKAILYLGPNVDEDKTGVSYRLDSRLFVARGCPSFTACGEYYYEWTGSGFKLLARNRMRPLVGSEAQLGRE